MLVGTSKMTTNLPNVACACPGCMVLGGRLVDLEGTDDDCIGCS